MDRQTNYKDMSPLGYQFLLDFCPLVLYVYSKGTGNEIFSDFFFMNVLVMTIGHQSVCLSWFYLPIWPRSCRALPLSTVCLQQRYQECNFFSIFVHIYLNYDHWSSVCLSILVLPPHMVQILQCPTSFYCSSTKEVTSLRFFVINLLIRSIGLTIVGTYWFYPPGWPSCCRALPGPTASVPPTGLHPDFFAEGAHLVPYMAL